MDESENVGGIHTKGDILHLPRRIMIGSVINAVPDNWRYGILVVLAIVAIAVLAKWAAPKTSSVGTGRSVTSRSPPQENVRELVQQASRWQAMAVQDQNPALGLMHASFAVAYANAARVFMTDEDIRNVVGINVQEFYMDLEKTQRAAFQSVSQRCPDAQPGNDYAVVTGWLA